MKLSGEQLPIESFFGSSSSVKAKKPAQPRKPRNVSAIKTPVSTVKRKGTVELPLARVPNKLKDMSSIAPGLSNLLVEEDVESVPDSQNSYEHSSILPSVNREKEATTLPRPKPTTIQMLPTPQTAGPSRRPRPPTHTGALFPSSSPPDPTPAPRTRITGKSAIGKTLSSHLPSPSTSARPRPPPRTRARVDCVNPSAVSQELELYLPYPRMKRPPSSPIRAGGARAVLQLRSPGRIDLSTPSDGVEPTERASSPVEPGEESISGCVVRRQRTDLASQTVVPTSQVYEHSLHLPLSPSRAASSRAVLSPMASKLTTSPMQQRPFIRQRSSTVVPSSQVFEHAFKLSPMRKPISGVSRSSPLRRAANIAVVTSPTVVPGTPTPAKMKRPHSTWHKRALPMLMDIDNNLPAPANTFLEALVGGRPAPLLNPSFMQSSQSQSEDEVGDELDSTRVAVAHSGQPPTPIQTSQTQFERDLVAATPSAFRHIAKGKQALYSRKPRSLLGTPTKHVSPGKHALPLQPLSPLKAPHLQHLTPKARRRVQVVSGSVRASPTQSTFAIWTSPPQMLSSSSEYLPHSNDPEVERMMEHMPTPLREFKEMFNDPAPISPLAARLAAAVDEEDSVTEDDDDEPLLPSRILTARKSRRSTSRSPRTQRVVRSSAASSPARGNGAFGSFPFDFSYPLQGGSFDENASRVDTLDAVNGFLEVFNHAPEDDDY